MDDETTFTIGDLAKRAGVTPRTIRYYTAEGLLPPPDTRGRYAHYGPEHLSRLMQISKLKADYLPLNVIRERLGEPTTVAVRQLREAAPPYSAMPRSTVPPPLDEPNAPTSLTPASGGDPFRPEAAPLQLGRYEFVPALPEPPPAEHTAHAQSAAPETWQRIVIEPGIELHIREALTVSQRRRAEAIIRAARDLTHKDHA